ncbi:Gti1/Pac2 family-domain-containing protein [Trametes elegans]|nr:Gti1/Pac2 family-domain-containing protein [Trametes elegans]
MSGHDSQNNGQWTEPPWSGWIETTGDALLILEAARRGLIPRVTRRLVDSERKMITSGSVFVFDEDESGIKRWTDGFFWSPSRILGNFLLYRETEKRGAGHSRVRAEAAAVEESESMKQEGQSLSRPKSESSRLGIDRQRERVLVGSLTNSYKFKPGGMMKKTFSLTIGGVAQHLISYYKIEDVEQGRLRSPSSLPELASLTISPEYLDKTHFRNPPKVEIGVDGIPRYRGEADDVELSPRLLPAPLSAGGYYGEAEPGSSKRSKRYDPYNSGANPPKRSRKKNNSASSQQEATGGESQPQPLGGDTVQHPQPAYPDPTVPHYPPTYGYYPVGPGYVPPMYSPSPYPPLPAPPTTTPPQDSPSPTTAPAAASSSPTYPYPDPASSAAASMYPSYYSGPPPPPPGYSAFPPPVPWAPHYGTYPPPTAPTASGPNIHDITESDVRNSGGGGGGGGGGA